MQILIVKMSSLGDVIHTLPALSDAQAHYPEIRFDWVVEDAFCEIPSWHSAVSEVLPINLRKWRKRPFRAWRNGEWGRFRTLLREKYYEKIIDAQGLMKSAFVAYQARGTRVGLDKHSAREGWASVVYQHKIAVPSEQHAVERLRQLFAQVLFYPRPNTPPDYGLKNYTLTTLMPSRPTLIFLHGTTWQSKHWPLSFWQGLAEQAAQTGFAVRLPWGNEVEYERAQRIAAVHADVSVMPASNLQGLAAELTTAVAAVGVDTGLAHLAAALNVPCLTLYGATRADLTGTYGARQARLCSQFPCAPCLQKKCTYSGTSAVFPACFAELHVQRVWEALLDLLAGKKFDGC